MIQTYTTEEYNNDGPGHHDELAMNAAAIAAAMDEDEGFAFAEQVKAHVNQSTYTCPLCRTPNLDRQGLIQHMDRNHRG